MFILSIQIKCNPVIALNKFYIIPYPCPGIKAGSANLSSK